MTPVSCFAVVGFAVVVFVELLSVVLVWVTERNSSALMYLDCNVKAPRNTPFLELMKLNTFCR